MYELTDYGRWPRSTTELLCTISSGSSLNISSGMRVYYAINPRRRAPSLLSPSPSPPTFPSSFFDDHLSRPFFPRIRCIVDMHIRRRNIYTIFPSREFFDIITCTIKLLIFWNPWHEIDNINFLYQDLILILIWKLEKINMTLFIIKINKGLKVKIDFSVEISEINCDYISENLKINSWTEYWSADDG